MKKGRKCALAAKIHPLRIIIYSWIAQSVVWVFHGPGLVPIGYGTTTDTAAAAAARVR